MAQVEVITGKQIEELDRLMLENKDMKKFVHKILSKVLSKARSDIAKNAHDILNNDPRQAYRAVKRTVYKRILGGNVSILAKRKASSIRVKVDKERTLEPGQRGGNRRKRSARTDKVDSYFGSDRGFILRFLNTGTAERAAYKLSCARRGNIAGRNWFGSSAQKNMEVASENFCKYIDEQIELIDKQYKHG